MFNPRKVTGGNFLFKPLLQVGSGLQDRDFHAGSRGVPQSDDFVIPRPTHPPSQSNRYSSWDSPSPDPYNVLSIFARHQKTQGKNEHLIANTALNAIEG